MNILQKICFVLLLTTFSSVYGWDCFKDKNIDNCREIAEQGDAESQYHLGKVYVKGQDVLQDYVMANMYSNIDSVNGDKDSVSNRDEGAKKTTSSQIERVENLVMEWMERVEYLVMEWVEKAEYIVKEWVEKAEYIVKEWVEKAEYIVMGWVERIEGFVMEWERAEGKLEYLEDRGGRTLIIIVLPIILLFYLFRIFKKRRQKRDYDAYFFRDHKKGNLERDYEEQEQFRKKREQEKEQFYQEQERQERKRKDRERQEIEEKIRLEKERRERQKRSRQKRESLKKGNEKTRTNEEILGLISAWAKSDLMSAYRKKCQQTHPDKWKGYPEDIVRAMEREYKEVQKAYKYLSKK